MLATLLLVVICVNLALGDAIQYDTPMRIYSQVGESKLVDLSVFGQLISNPETAYGSLTNMFAAMGEVIKTLFTSGFAAVSGMDPILLANAHAALSLLIMAGAIALLLFIVLSAISKVAKIAFFILAIVALLTYMGIDYQAVFYSMSSLVPPALR